MTLRLQVGACTDVGQVREGNEDAYMVHEPQLFAVADGMGGHQGGEVASKLALEKLERAADGASDLAEVVREANRAVFSRASEDPGLAGMGTTLTAVLVDGNRLHLAHVGDSRMYLLSDARLQQITKDHTVVQRMVDEGRLTPKEAGIHPQRSILTRALGVDEEVQVDEADVEVRPGDRILLCSDGLTGMVEEDQIQRILTETRDPQAACQALVEAANQAGGQDNITAVVLDVVEGSAGTAPQAAVTETVQRPGAAVPARPQAAPQSVPTRQERFDARPGASRRRWGRALIWLTVALLLIGGGLFALKRYWVDRQWYVGESNGQVALYRGIPAAPLGFELSEVVEETELPADEVTPFPEYRELDEGITAESEGDARAILDRMRADVNQARREARMEPGP